MAKRRSTSCAFWPSIPFLTSNIAYADDMSDARASGVATLRKLEQRKNAEVWESDVRVGLKKG